MHSVAARGHASAPMPRTRAGLLTPPCPPPHSALPRIAPPPPPQYLVHALAALAAMGLADLWLIMNLSAQFAHAKRDLADLRRSSRWAATGAGLLFTRPAPTASPPNVLPLFFFSLVP
jgi:hypothetical protein